ncbi:MAG TPA: hypothetical protein VHP35_18270, partial [Terriglobia bacterium]|nr:hypothetical protein [Terriglobia bacterium]
AEIQRLSLNLLPIEGTLEMDRTSAAAVGDGSLRAAFQMAAIDAQHRSDDLLNELEVITIHRISRNLHATLRAFSILLVRKWLNVGAEGGT